MSGTYQQAMLSVVDPGTFEPVRSAVEAAFSQARVAEFLRLVERGSLRVRDFEGVLAGGKLGASAAAEYERLGNSDRGQIRELYLASLEKVSPELRAKYLKLYAYY